MKKVILVDVLDGIKTIHNVLDGDASIVEVYTLEQALSLAKVGAELIVCGIHFSDSRMFDLVRLVKADVATRVIPLVCFRNMDSGLPRALFEGLEIACGYLGAVGFVDLFELKCKYGVQEADKQFRQKFWKLWINQSSIRFIVQI